MGPPMGFLFRNACRGEPSPSGSNSGRRAICHEQLAQGRGLAEESFNVRDGKANMVDFYRGTGHGRTLEKRTGCVSSSAYAGFVTGDAFAMSNSHICTPLS